MADSAVVARLLEKAVVVSQFKLKHAGEWLAPVFEFRIDQYLAGRIPVENPVDSRQTVHCHQGRAQL